MKVQFRFIASVLVAQAFSVSYLSAEETGRVRLSDKAPAVEPSAQGNSAPATTPNPLPQGPALPAAAFSAQAESTVVVAIAPSIGDQAPIIAADSSKMALMPMQSMLGVKTVPMFAPLKAAGTSAETVTAAAAPVFGPPQLPSMAKLTAIRPATTEPVSASFMQDPAVQEAAPATPAGDGSTTKIDLNTIIGGLKSQEAIFGNLDIDPTAITTEATVGPAQRLEYLPDGSVAAWQGDIYCWTAPDFFHNPLYFEQVNLERYGQGTYEGLQPAASAAHFFATIPILPYKIGGQEWCERVYTLGHRRPGNCNPYQIHYHPFSWRGVTYQAAATTGVVFIVP